MSPMLLDVEVYRGGGRALWEGTPLYGQGFPELPFTYPPFAAVIFMPLAALPEPFASILWTFGTVAALYLCMFLFLRDHRHAAAATAVGLLTEPVWENLTFGQINVYLAALVLVDALLPHRFRGALIGLAAAIKLTPAIFVLVLRKHDIARAAAAFVGATGLGCLFAPEDSRRYWLEVVHETSRIGGLGYVSNQSWRGFLERIDAPQWWLVAVVFTLALAALRHKSVLLVGVVGLLCSPVSWSHHFVWYVFIAVWFTSQARWAWAAAAWAVVLARMHWWVPNDNDLEYTWEWWQHLPGNAYLWWGLILVAFGARRVPHALRQ